MCGKPQHLIVFCHSHSPKQYWQGRCRSSRASTWSTAKDSYPVRWQKARFRRWRNKKLLTCTPGRHIDGTAMGCDVTLEKGQIVEEAKSLNRSIDNPRDQEGKVFSGVGKLVPTGTCAHVWFASHSSNWRLMVAFDGSSMSRAQSVLETRESSSVFTSKSKLKSKHPMGCYH